MSYDPQVGDAVLIEHPFMRDVVIAYIAKVTTKMVGVQHLDRYGNLNTSETHTRSRNAIVGKLRDDITMKEAQKALREAREKRQAAEKAVEEAWTADQRDLLERAPT